MADWRTKKAVYEVHESTGRRTETIWYIMTTGNELHEMLDAKQRMHGYIPGEGGNRNYRIWAVELTG